MNIHFITYLDFFILFIILTKICFLFFASGDAVLHRSSNTYINTVVAPAFSYYKSTTEVIYIVSMSILIIYIFKFRKEGITGVENTVGTLLFLFAAVLIITANWSIFFKNKIWYEKIVTFISVK
jgi:hypothetical protein